MSQKLSRRGFLGCACCAAVSVGIAGRLPVFAAEAHTNLTPDQALETLRGFRRFWHRGPHIREGSPEPTGDGPEAWRAALLALPYRDPCPGFRPGMWTVICSRALSFIEEHGDRAAALDWTAEELFGVHRVVCRAPGLLWRADARRRGPGARGRGRPDPLRQRARLPLCARTPSLCSGLDFRSALIRTSNLTAHPVPSSQCRPGWHSRRASRGSAWKSDPADELIGVQTGPTLPQLHAPGAPREDDDRQKSRK